MTTITTIRSIVVALIAACGSLAASNAFPAYTPALVAIGVILSAVNHALPRAETAAVKGLKAEVAVIKQEGIAPSAEVGLKIRESLNAANQTFGPEGGTP